MYGHFLDFVNVKFVYFLIRIISLSNLSRKPNSENCFLNLKKNGRGIMLVVIDRTCISFDSVQYGLVIGHARPCFKHVNDANQSTVSKNALILFISSHVSQFHLISVKNSNGLKFIFQTSFHSNREVFEYFPSQISAEHNLIIV